jgi:hypothetical protein
MTGCPEEKLGDSFPDQDVDAELVNPFPEVSSDIFLLEHDIEFDLAEPKQGSNA